MDQLKRLRDLSIAQPTPKREREREKKNMHLALVVSSDRDSFEF
jgi:hypothetical protein